MKKDRWLQILERFKDDERPECVLVGFFRITVVPVHATAIRIKSALPATIGTASGFSHRLKSAN